MGVEPGTRGGAAAAGEIPGVLTPAPDLKASTLSTTDGRRTRRRGALIPADLDLLAQVDLLEASTSLLQRIEAMIPPESVLKEYPKPTRKDKWYKREVIDKHYKGADYVLITIPDDDGKQRPYIVPAHHSLARLEDAPATTPGTHYAKASFEGLSALSIDGVGHLALLGPRMNRWQKSVDSQDFDVPVSTPEMTLGIKDYAAILGPSVFGDPDKPTRAYVRPFAILGNGPMGVASSPDNLVSMGAIIWNWPTYFKEASEKVYRGEGLDVIVQPNQRTEIPTGKNSVNYGRASKASTDAKAEGGNESLYFATFYAHGDIGPKNRGRTALLKDEAPEDLREHMLNLAIADGPGEEIITFARRDDGKVEMLYPPTDVGRLGGTTLDYIINYIAPKLGIPTRETYWSLQDVVDGKVEPFMAMVGNAVMVAPVGKFRLFDQDRRPILDDTGQPLVIPMRHPDELPELRAIQGELEAEFAGVAESHPSLLTRVASGPEVDEARALLDKTFAKWF